MKVAFILPSLLNRGPVVFTRYLAHALMDLGTEVTVFYIKPLIEVEFNCECRQLDFFSSKQLDNFDIINTTMLRPDIYGLLHSHKFNGVWVVSMHNEIKSDLRFLYHPLIAWVIENIWKLALIKCSNIIVSSIAQRDYYVNMLGFNKKYGLIGYGITRKDFNNLEFSESVFLTKLKSQYTIVGSCGLLIARKGFDLLVDLLVYRKELAVVLVGDGDQREHLTQKARLLGVSDRLHILGFKSNHIDYYAYFDIYAMTSYSEGFGLAMIEAMSVDLPIVCSDLEIYRDHFSSADVGIFRVGDVLSLVDAVDAVLLMKYGYSKKSSDLFERKFSAKGMAQKHIEYFREVLGR